MSGRLVQSTQTSPDRLLDVREAAEMLGLKPSTLYQWAYERRIPVVKLFGRALRFRMSDLQKLVTGSVRPALGSGDRQGKLTLP